MKSRLFFGAAALLVLAAALPLSAQSGAKCDRNEGAGRQQADEILSQLKQIRQLLEKMQASAIRAATGTAPSTVSVSSAGYSLGSADAPLALVEFSDYQCPFCAQFQAQTFPDFKKNYVDTGKVRFIIRDLPLEIHPFAMPAAEAAHCAGEQGKFWEMRDLLVIHSTSLQPVDIDNYGTQTGLEMNQFRACLNRQAFLLQINQDLAEAKAAGISGTPSFVFGRVDKDSVKGIVLVGNLPLATLDEKVRQALADPR